MADISLERIDITTPQPNGKFGENTKSANEKHNRNMTKLEAAIGAGDPALAQRVTAVEGKAQANEAAIAAEVAARAEAATYLNNAKFDKSGGTVTGTTRFNEFVDVGKPADVVVRIGTDGENRCAIQATNKDINAYTPMNFWSTGFKFNANLTTSGAYQVRQSGSGQQAVMMSYGRSTGEQRWTVVIEGGGAEDLCYYRYPGGVPTQAMSIRQNDGLIQSHGAGFSTMGPSSGYQWGARNNSTYQYVMYALDNSMRFFCQGVGDLVTIDSAGNGNFLGRLTANGGIGPGSDPAIKKNVQPHGAVLDKLASLNVATGEYLEEYGTPGERSFVMADEALSEAFPHLVTYTSRPDGKAHRGWDAFSMISVLVKAVQELRADNAELRFELETLRGVMEA
ncbi:hypothetical protein [Stenotrophomonas phage BUCT603]|nr:hypothetical protein [Stenotrophomonas phage BUCT603]